MPTRASSSANAREYKKKGHYVEKLFAQEIGVNEEYRNNPQGKKDVVDFSGDTHSVKSGEKKWQIFLYSRNRFINDDSFQALNGIGILLIHCLDAFPLTFEEYENDKDAFRERLKTPMRDIKDRLQRKALLRAFLSISLFNGSEVNYLTVYFEKKFHVFKNSDVISALGGHLAVENSEHEQKVVMKYKGFNVAELEMRTDQTHYVKVRFNGIIQKFLPLLRENISPVKKSKISNNIYVYGEANRTFGNWPFTPPPAPEADMDKKLEEIIQQEEAEEIQEMA